MGSAGRNGVRRCTKRGKEYSGGTSGDSKVMNWKKKILVPPCINQTEVAGKGREGERRVVARILYEGEYLIITPV